MTTNLGRTMLRMRKELEELEDSPREGIVCYPIDDNITHLQAGEFLLVECALGTKRTPECP